MSHFNITIIGNRIAAAAALISLGQRLGSNPPLKIALVAPSPSQKQPQNPTQKHQHRVGESLPPTIKPLLQKMDLWDDFSAQNYPTSEARFTCWDNEQLQPTFAHHTPYGFGWCIDRLAFENSLWQKAKQIPFTTINAIFKHSEKTAEGWHLRLSDGQTIETDFVLDCTGRAASFAKTQSERQKGSQMVAACDFLPPLNQQVHRSAGGMIEAVEQGWWYSSLLPNGELAIAYFTDREHIAKSVCHDKNQWQQNLNNSQYTKLRVETGEFADFNQPRIHDASMSSMTEPTGDGWLACGDAAMALDPLSAHGMTTALWSGYKGANACIDSLNGDSQPLQQYNDSCKQNWQTYCEQRQAMYQRQAKYADSAFWRQF